MVNHRKQKKISVLNRMIRICVQQTGKQITRQLQLSDGLHMEWKRAFILVQSIVDQRFQRFVRMKLFITLFEIYPAVAIKMNLS